MTLEKALNLAAITQRESTVIDWLAKQLYPMEHKTIAKNRVRARIRDARTRGDLPGPVKERGKKILTLAEFFEWACEQSGWEKLSTIPNLRKNVTVRVEAPPAMKIQVGDVLVEIIPKSQKECEELIRWQNKKIAAHEALEKEMKQTIEELKDQLHKKARAAEIGSESGKLGGRPKK